jgi:valyl-tRNA synthetase
VGRTLEEATERAKTLANGKNSRLDEDEDVLDTLFSSGLWVFSILDKRYAITSSSRERAPACDVYVELIYSISIVLILVIHPLTALGH